MREIKFRAWTVSRYMAYQGTPDLETIQSFFNHFGDEGDILMQYTGLKDKNGVEIYEGDIVKINDNWNNENKSVTTYSTYEVKANLIVGLCFSCLEISEQNKRVYRREIGDDAELGNWMYKHLEVIGNIYERQK